MSYWPAGCCKLQLHSMGAFTAPHRAPAKTPGARPYVVPCHFCFHRTPVLWGQNVNAVNVRNRKNGWNGLPQDFNCPLLLPSSLHIQTFYHICHGEFLVCLPFLILHLPFTVLTWPKMTLGLCPLAYKIMAKSIILWGDVFVNILAFSTLIGIMPCQLPAVINSVHTAPPTPSCINVW